MKIFTKKLLLAAVVVGLVIAFVVLLRSPNGVASQQAHDIAVEKSRFTPQQSVDIAMAMKLVTHDPPSMLNPPKPGPPLLLYPPSDADLARLSGE